MITYVNTVFVSNNANAAVLTKAQFEALTTATAAANKGMFVIYDVDASDYINSITSTVKRIKIGIVTGKVAKDHKGVGHVDVRWSNIINRDDVKSFAKLIVPVTDPNTEDSIEIDFTNVDASVVQKWAEGGKRVIVRLTFKDLPTRFRKWTESYEYVTKFGDDEDAVADGLATIINKQWKRARVVADGTTTAGKLVLTAMPYDDDDSVDSINWTNKVRFNANVYYTDPAAEGWESLNKHYPKDLVITKTPGFMYAASGKLVRDRESQALGYLGILNRGEGTWPIIKPAMETDITKNYDAITLEFENMYRAADDIFRKTKQTVELYVTAGKGSAIATILKAFADKATTIDEQTEDGVADE